MTGLAALIGDFAALLTPHPGNDEHLTRWIDQARTENLPHLHAFTRGQEQLYEDARRQNIRGRSKMTKAQLENALTRSK